MRVPALLLAALSCADAYVTSIQHQLSRHVSPRRSLHLSAFSGGGNNNNSNRNRVSDFGKTQTTQQQLGTGIGNAGQYGGGFDSYSGNDGGYDISDSDGYGYNSAASSQQFKSDQFLQHVSDFCIGCNEFWKSLVLPPMRDWLETRPGGTALSNPLSKIQAGPEYPGISRPVWLVMAGSFATLFNWFGYYKFVVEEELVRNFIFCLLHSMYSIASIFSLHRFVLHNHRGIFFSSVFLNFHLLVTYIYIHIFSINTSCKRPDELPHAAVMEHLWPMCAAYLSVRPWSGRTFPVANSF